MNGNLRTLLKDFSAKISLSAARLTKTLEQLNVLLLKTSKLTYELYVNFIVEWYEF